MIAIKKVTLQEVDAMIIPCYSGQLEVGMEAVAAKGLFTGKKGELFYVNELSNGIKYNIYLGLGDEKELNGESFRRGLAQAIKKARALKAESIGIKLPIGEKICTGGCTRIAVEAAMLSTYTFNSYKTDQKAEKEMDIYLINVPEEKQIRANQIIKETLNVAEGVIMARNLVNEPSNKLYPETLAAKVEALGKESGFSVEVMDEAQIEALGMEAFLAVGKGSERKPRLIVMRYMGAPDNAEILGLVGKGLTYDTGGYSLKPTESMKTMHSDMGGAATVIGAMMAMAKNKVKKNVVAVAAACENVISGGSYKPGDIIGSMAGKSIEILNTDAEGRLTLADAVTYIIEKEKATQVIDIATLTGAALVALGTTTTAAVTNNEAFYETLKAAADKTGERFWELPHDEEYAELNKSDIADLKNVGGKNAGTITAGLFVGEFAKSVPWIHLDIAGTAWSDVEEHYITKGGTGAVVRTLYQLVSTPCGCHHK